jgi:hypothetical protein
VKRHIELFLPAEQRCYDETELDKLSDLEYIEATIEDCISYLEQDFSWGEVLNIHTIGEYQIVEYSQFNEDENKTEIWFEAYRNYERSHYTADTLEKAITGAICCKYDGVNSQANKFLWKMISK